MRYFFRTLQDFFFYFNLFVTDFKFQNLPVILPSPSCNCTGECACEMRPPSLGLIPDAELESTRQSTLREESSSPTSASSQEDVSIPHTPVEETTPVNESFLSQPKSKKLQIICIACRIVIQSHKKLKRDIEKQQTNPWIKDITILRLFSFEICNFNSPEDNLVIFRTGKERGHSETSVDSG